MESESSRLLMGQKEDILINYCDGMLIELAVIEGVKQLSKFVDCVVQVV